MSDEDMIRRGDAKRAFETLHRTKSGYSGMGCNGYLTLTDATAQILDYIPAVRVLTAQPSPDEHYDDYCIRQFAKMMSEKMAASRAKGRSGWNDPEKCSVEYLRALLYEHLDKGDPVDVANFCMMLRHYEASTYREACNCQPQPSPEVAALVEALETIRKISLCSGSRETVRTALASVKGGEA